VYRARTSDDSAYFLKVRLSVANEPGLLVPRYLRDQGIAHVIAPLPATTGALWTTAGGYALILYPFVAGATGMERGMSDRQWIDYGALLRQIHAVAIPPDLARIMRRETFIPDGADAIRRLDAHIGTRDFDDPAASALATFWRAHREEIGTLLRRAEDLGRRFAEAARPFVLCHADAHTNNVLLDDDGQVWMVDWDETALAPKERDLMFVMGGGIRDDLVGPRDEELFLQGYGATGVDPLGLAYYRYAWAVSDIGAYGEQVLLRPDLGPITRQASVERFESLFNPGSIVALAFAAKLGAS
jgi:spectinomycin phosphotransferase